MAEQRRRRTAVRVMIYSPLIVLAFILTGVLLGSYLADFVGISRLILELILAGGGLLVSFPVIRRMIQWMVAKEEKEPGIEKPRS